MLIIKVCKREEEVCATLATIWAKKFAKILEILPKRVGEIIYVRQWLRTIYGREFLG